MARYADAISWIAWNDDTEWIADEEPSMSVTACLVADMWGKTKDQVIADLWRALAQRKGSE